MFLQFLLAKSILFLAITIFPKWTVSYSHVILGEMHFEFRKGQCLDKGRSCEFCLTNDDALDTIKSVPQPLPNYEELPYFHYLPVDQTSLQLEDGSDRNVDDFHT